MAEKDVAPPPAFRLMNFVSQDQLDESKKNRGERVEDGTAQRDRPLFEILKENKDKKDAEFNERFKHMNGGEVLLYTDSGDGKHGPPKALDEDETEFLENVEMSRKEYERKMANEEAQELQSFKAAVAARTSMVHELKEAPPVPKVEEAKPKPHVRKNPPPAVPLGGLIIKVKPQPKKAKIEETASQRPSTKVETSNGNSAKSSNVAVGALGGLVSYSDESDEDDS